MTQDFFLRKEQVFSRIGFGEKVGNPGAGGFGDATIGGESAGGDDLDLRVAAHVGIDGGGAIHDGYDHVSHDDGDR